MKAPLLLLSLALVGCVTVQPCVCPTAPATQPECDPILNPEACTVYDGLRCGLPKWAKVPSVKTLEAFGDNSDTSLNQTTVMPRYAQADRWPLGTTGKLNLKLYDDSTRQPLFEPFVTFDSSRCLVTDPSGETEYGKGTAWLPCPYGVEVWCSVSTGKLLPDGSMETKTVPCDTLNDKAGRPR